MRYHTFAKCITCGQFMSKEEIEMGLKHLTWNSSAAYFGGDPDAREEYEHIECAKKGLENGSDGTSNKLHG